MKQRRILVIRPDRVGDVVLATPLIRELRKTFPDAFIGALVRPQTKDILLNNPNLDVIITDNYENSDKGLKGFLKKIFELKKYKFNIALHLLPTQRHAWMTFLAGIRTRINVGVRLYSVLTFMRSVSRNKYIPLRHEADYTLDLGRKIGLKSENLEPEIFLTLDEIETAKKLVTRNEGEFIIGINPSSGRSAPNWLPDKYLNLVQIILQRIPESKIYINLANDPDLEKIFSSVDSERVSLINNTTLRQLILYISRFDVLVSASTGPMHIASALKIPTVSMFCPLPACSPKLWGPLGNKAEIILPPESFCQTHCPGDPHICTFDGGIEPEKVFESIEKILTEKKTKSQNDSPTSALERH